MDDLSVHRRLYGSIRRGLPELGSPALGRIAALKVADANRVSVTPVREVLFRLAGERLVDLHPDGGFSLPALDARALADLDAWNGHHLLAALHLLPEGVVGSVMTRAGGHVPVRHIEVVDRIEDLFEELGRATGNGEFVSQIDTASARLRAARLVEDRLFPDTGRELRSMVRRVVSDAKANVRRRIHAYHRRRVEHAGQLAALLSNG